MQLSSKLLCVLSTLVLLAAAGCGSGGSESAPVASITAPQAAGSQSADRSADPAKTQLTSTTSSTAEQQVVKPEVNLHPEIVIKTSKGDIRVKLNAEKAPVTVDNFLHSYVDRGFYEGTIFHHVEQGFMIVGGGYDQELNEKEPRAPIRNESDNGLKNVRGTLAMTRHPDYADSATSQFFINLVDNPSLDYQSGEDEALPGYCVFGEVVEGIEVVDAIAKTEVEQTDQFSSLPTETVVIESIERIEP